MSASWLSGGKRRERKRKLPRPQRGATGNALWRIKGAGSYYWNGPGASLKLLFGDQLVSITPLEGESYGTFRDAESALLGYLDRFDLPRAHARSGR